jgi:hypothetical protein
MKLTPKLKAKIDDYFDSITPEELHNILVEKYGFEEEVTIDVALWMDDDFYENEEDFKRAKPYLTKRVKQLTKDGIFLVKGDMLSVYDDSMEDFIELTYFVKYRCIYCGESKGITLFLKP